MVVILITVLAQNNMSRKCFITFLTTTAQTERSDSNPRLQPRCLRSSHTSLLRRKVAMILSAIGIYALISYSVSQRTREIGVRIALGAQRSNVLGLVLREGLQVLAFGLLLGLVGALSATRIMRSLLYSTSATDALSFIATSFTLIAVALL